jgi:tRNA(Ile)-lysidine synthase
VTGEGDVRSVAKRDRAGIEEAARTMRYQFLAFVAGKEQCDAIATGHTAGDQTETVLMRIVRGSGVRGIRGMLPSSNVPGAPSQRLIRPILCLGRVDTEAICREAGIKPLLDSSNDDLSITRNRIRNETLPALRALNPSVDAALRGLAASAREAFEGVEREAMTHQPRERTAVGAIFAMGPFAALHDEARTLVIEREAAFYHLQPDVNRTRVENLGTMLRRGTGEVRFGDTVVGASCGSVRVGPHLGEAEPFEAKVLNVPGATIAGPRRVDVRTEPLPSLPGALMAAIDASSIRGALQARPLRAADRMLFRGRERLVRDVLSNEKVPRWERPGALEIADSSRVLAVFTASQAIAAVADGDDRWHVRVSPAPAH